MAAEYKFLTATCTSTTTVVPIPGGTPYRVHFLSNVGLGPYSTENTVYLGWQDHAEQLVELPVAVSSGGLRYDPLTAHANPFLFFPRRPGRQLRITGTTASHPLLIILELTGTEELHLHQANASGQYRRLSYTCGSFWTRQYIKDILPRADHFGADQAWLSFRGQTLIHSDNALGHWQLSPDGALFPTTNNLPDSMWSNQSDEIIPRSSP